MTDSPSTISNPPSISQPPRLEHPVRITDQSWPEGTVPIVSIICFAYNHEKFIREAIEGFLMQETTFPVEIIIHDDASTDGTADIIREYESKHPQIFRNMLQKENHMSQGGDFNGPIFQHTRGEFIALCEGDDYWIHKEKLELQMNLIQRDIGSTFCSAKAKVLSDSGQYVGHICPSYIKAFYNLSDVIRNYLFHTSTFLIRKKTLVFPEWFYSAGFTNGDEAIVALCAGAGQLAYLDKVVSVYRQHQGGMWTGRSKIEAIKSGKASLDAINAHYMFAYTAEVRQRYILSIKNALNNAINDRKYSEARAVFNSFAFDIYTFGCNEFLRLMYRAYMYPLILKWHRFTMLISVRTRLRRFLSHNEIKRQ